MLSLIVGACLAMGACAFGPPPPDQSGAPPNLPTPSASTSDGDGGDPSTVAVLASHLVAPWGIAFLPDGSALVTERTSAKILHVAPPATPSGLTVTAVATVIGVDGAGDGGLLGIAVSPQYATDHTVYVYYSTRTDNRIGSVTLTVALSGSQSAAPPSAPPSTPPTSTPPSISPSPAPAPALAAHPILTGIPHGATDNGGWLAFGPDHYLYASTGDTGHPATSQDRKSLAGKILRMTVAGKVAPGNPIAGSLIYAYGLRDVEGFDWDLANRMYAMDAARTADALYQIAPGANYGWSATSPKPGGTPIQTWPLAQSTCPGVALVDNVLVTACLTGTRAWVMQLTGRGTPFGAPTAELSGTYGRLRAVVVAPDGSLWLTTSNTDGHGSPAPTDDRIINLILSDAGAGNS